VVVVHGQLVPRTWTCFVSLEIYML
jgi:hypothetical protein